MAAQPLLYLTLRISRATGSIGVYNAFPSRPGHPNMVLGFSPVYLGFYSFLPESSPTQGVLVSAVCLLLPSCVFRAPLASPRPNGLATAFLRSNQKIWTALRTEDCFCQPMGLSSLHRVSPFGPFAFALADLPFPSFSSLFPALYN